MIAIQKLILSQQCMIEYDFRKDCEEIAKEYLLRNGYVDENEIKNNEYDFLLELFNLNSHQIYRRRRKIVFSKGFFVPKEVRSNFREFCRDVTRGNDINVYATKLHNKIKECDKMFAHWNIHHFHMGLKTEDGKVERSNFLLFAFLDGDVLYCLKIDRHLTEKFYDDKILQILGDNWPNLIKKFEMDEVKKLEVQPSDIKGLHKGNINYAMTINEKKIFGPGMGTTLDGHLVSAVMSYTHFVRLLNKLEQFVLSNSENLAKKICKTKDIEMSAVKNIKLQLLSVEDGGFVLKEIFSNLSFLISIDLNGSIELL